MKGGARREVTTPLEVVGWHVGLVSPTSTGHWDSICGGKCIEFRTEEETKIRKQDEERENDAVAQLTLRWWRISFLPHRLQLTGCSCMMIVHRN